MTKIVPLPIVTWNDEGCHYAGKRYEHTGEIMKTVPPGEWQKLVEVDTLKRLKAGTFHFPFCGRGDGGAA